MQSGRKRTLRLKSGPEQRHGHLPQKADPEIAERRRRQRLKAPQEKQLYEWFPHIGRQKPRQNWGGCGQKRNDMSGEVTKRGNVGKIHQAELYAADEHQLQLVLESYSGGPNKRDEYQQGQQESGK